MRLRCITFALGVLYAAALASRPDQRTAAQVSEALPRYTFDVNLDYAAHRLDAVQRVTLPNTYGRSIGEVLFNVPAAHTSGIFDLHGVEVGGQAAVYDFQGTTLAVKLPAPLQPDQTTSLTLRFTVNVPSLADAQSFASANLAYTGDAMNIGYWYPLLAPYQSGWVTVPWYPIGDPFASESADYTATITADLGVTVVSGGALTRHGNVWHYDLPRARTFGMLASSRYREATIKMGRVTYSLYTLPEHAHLADAGLETMVRALTLFSTLYGPYPYSTLRVAEVSGPWSMEFSGFCALGATDIGDYNGTPRNRLTRIMAHEISHQWWYGVVGDNQVREPWLDEGLARFNELRYYEAYSPQDAQWWWNTVIGTLRGALPLNSAVNDFADHGTYLVSIYNQGAVFLDDLRSTIGQPAFDAFLQDLYRRGSFQLITTQDFFDTLEYHSEVNVQALIRRYFR